MAADLLQVLRDLRDQLDHYKTRVEEQNTLLRRKSVSRGYPNGGVDRSWLFSSGAGAQSG